MLFEDGPFKDVLLDPDGVSHYANDDEKEITIHLCRVCDSSLKKNKIPPLSYANHTYLGKVPDELKHLTVVEEVMVARCHAKSWVVQLKEENSDLQVPTAQRGLQGHVIIFPQQPEALVTLLPPPVADIITPICVVFVGAHPPSPEWLAEKAKPLIVRWEV